MSTPYRATIEKDGWQLDDGEALHRQYPATFQIPETEQRYNLQSGELVKLIFRFTHDDKPGDIYAERMWVEVQGREGDFYYGKLESTPFIIETLREGDVIWFEPHHVVATYD